MNLGFREKVLQECRDVVAKKIAALNLEMTKIQDSANNETKSSMGDKYETGRAMAQHELEKASQNLNEKKAQLAVLNKLTASKENNVRNGSLVYTENEIFFLAIPLGQIEIEGNKLYAISANSPIGKAMIGKIKGDSLVFNGQTKLIKEVYNS